MANIALHTYIIFAEEDNNTYLRLTKSIEQFKAQGYIGDVEKQCLDETTTKGIIQPMSKIADVVWVIVSEQLIQEEYLHGAEFSELLQRHAKGKTTVVPIMKEEVLLNGTPLENLPLLPTRGWLDNTIIWNNEEEAWANVEAGMQRIMDGIRSSSVPSPSRIQFRLKQLIESGKYDKIINDSAFVFEEVRQQFNDFKVFKQDELQGSRDIELLNVKNFFNEFLESLEQSELTYKDYEDKILKNKEVAELLNFVKRVVNGCLFHEELRPYLLEAEDIPRKYWVTDLLLYRVNHGDTEGLNFVVQRAIDYLEEPESETTILAQNHQEQIAEKVLGTSYNDEHFSSMLLQYFRKLGLKTANPANLSYLCAALLYDEEVSVLWLEKETIIPIKRPEGLPVYMSDTASGEDKLDITPDVQAFAKLIAAKNLKPPMSIGLFGNWGSGKSFFMRQMWKEINDITLDVAELPKQEIAYCKRIVQIEFNAWHYIDANLWASLVTTIFQKLSDFVGNKSEEELHEMQLQERLAAEQKTIEKLVAEKQLLETEKKKLEIRIAEEERPDKEKEAELKAHLSQMDSRMKVIETREEEARQTSDELALEIDTMSRTGVTVPQELYKELATTKEMMREADAEKVQAMREQNELWKEVDKFRKAKAEKKRLLNAITIDQIYEEIKRDPALAKQVAQAKEKLGFEDIDFSNIAELQRLLNDYNTTQGRGVNVLYAIMKEVKGVRGWLVFLLILGFSVVTILGTSFFELDSFNAFMANIVAIIMGGMTIVGRFVSAVQPALKTVKSGITHLETAKERFLHLEKIKEDALNREVNRLKLEYDELQQKELLAIKRLEEARQRVAAIEQEMDEIRKGKRLSSFIERRLGSNDYQQHLGIISMIRADFDQLSAYLQKIQEEGEGGIDRIVLYIDDLDRCPPNKVVEVLQAIHLLLAFPLFVVVVGVDVRWVSQSLLRRYDNMMAKTSGEIEEYSEFQTTLQGSATPFDYLEKIFQIPFKIKPLSEDDKDTFIEGLLANDIQWHKDKLKGKVKEHAPNTKKVASNETHVTDDIPSNQPSLVQTTTDQNERRPKPEIATPQAEIYNPDFLKLTLAEVEFMQLISPMMGSSPRAIKRYINVYRLIKSNSRWSPVREEDSQDQYREILFLLAVIVGSPSISQHFFEQLAASTKGETLSDFMQEFKQFGLTANPRQQRDLHQLTQALYNPSNRDTIAIDKIKAMNIRDLQNILPIVARFSFRLL